MFSELEEQVAGFVTVGALLMDFFFPLRGISLFCDHGGCGLVWFGFADWEVEVDLHLRSFEAFFFCY